VRVAWSRHDDEIRSRHSTGRPRPSISRDALELIEEAASVGDDGLARRIEAQKGRPIDLGDAEGPPRSGRPLHPEVLLSRLACGLSYLTLYVRQTLCAAVCQAGALVILAIEARTRNVPCSCGQYALA